MTTSPQLNIAIRGERETLTIWIHKDGSLVFDMVSNDRDDPAGGGQVSTPAAEFRVLLDKLLGPQDEEV